MQYAGSAGNDQKTFLKDTEIGWKKILHNASLHIPEGRSQYEYEELVLEKLTGLARKCMENHLIKWNWNVTEEENQPRSRNRARGRSGCVEGVLPR